MTTATAQTGDSLQRVLLLLDPASASQASLSQLRADLTAVGGRAIHIYPPSGLIAKLPSQALAPLAGRPDMVAVLTDPVPAEQFSRYPTAAQPLIHAWNNLLNPVEPEQGTPSSQAAQGYGRAFWPPDLPPDGDPSGGSSLTPGYYQTSEFMAGSVAVGLILLESNGTGDPST
ncbi:MAG TPA: hypothetical protein PKD98_12205, partial [Anaerolineae bacterium]|nr:hypothetical protein [Anaerolineae bacterium]